MDRNLVLNLGRVTEAAALACAKYLGKGDKNMADQAAVDGMRRMFDTLDIDGVVVIGEGEMDEAPMLYIGEKIGRAGADDLKVDIAVDPVDGTTSVANGLPNAISVVAVAPRGCLLHAPDTYMKKIAVGPRAKGVIDIHKSASENIRNVAEALGKSLDEITVEVLDRPRHDELIKEIRATGARIKLVSDGDVLSAISTCFEYTGVDITMGIGGAPEGVITAVALKCLGGDFQGILAPANEEHRARCIEMGAELDRVYYLDDLAKGNKLSFAATGVSYGELLDGVKYMKDNTASTHTLILRSETGTIRFIKSIHKLDKKPDYAK
ncbi:MAG: class II fructose-bisphosphatase [Tissierellaceae bacterium]|mgnify:CR=1 FL=1|jgi:fructose-1,6-bisphosphatase II|nr:class II fructose-bisphosphatase [Tissierellia bacterium]